MGSSVQLDTCTLTRSQVILQSSDRNAPRFPEHESHNRHTEHLDTNIGSCEPLLEGRVQVRRNEFVPCRTGGNMTLAETVGKQLGVVLNSGGASTRELTTRKLDRIVHFYSEVIGFDVARYRPGVRVVLRSGNTTLSFIQAGSNCSGAFIYLKCEDLTDVRNHLERVGAEILTPRGRSDSVMVKDPDGNILVIRPEETQSSHGRLTPEQREEAGITDNLIRVAVGLEDLADIQVDLERGFAAI